MNEDLVLKHTFLSRKPKRSGSYAALVTLILVFGISVTYWENHGSLAPYLAASKKQAFSEFELWRLFTALLVHSDFRHFLSNALPLVFLSAVLYGYYGPWIYPVMMVTLGCLTNAFALWSYETNVTLVGASGMVYCMAGFWLAMYMGIERRFSLFIRFLRCAGFTLVMLFPTTFEPQVSYRSHAIGFAFGIVTGVFYFTSNRMRFRDAEVYRLEE